MNLLLQEKPKQARAAQIPVRMVIIHWPVGPKKEHRCIVQLCILPIFQKWIEEENTEIILVTSPWMSSASNLYLP